MSSHKWLHHLDAWCGKCPDAARLHHQHAEKTRKQGVDRIRPVPTVRLLGQLEHGETCSNAEATRGHNASVHAVVFGLKLADPGITTEPRGLTASQSRTADIFTTAAVPGRSAALDVCVASPSAAAARGDAAQASFDCKLTNDRNEIPDLRNQGIHHRLLVWTAHCSMQETSHPASRCWRNRFSAEGNIKFKLLPFAVEQP